MTRDDIVSILTARRWKLTELGVASLRLFGSFGHDRGGPDSDVDFLVQFDGAATFDRYMDLKLWLQDELGRPVDLVTIDGLRPELRPAIERDAVDVA